MAQERSFQEEFECQSPPEAPVVCANNCGFFGHRATMDLCSKCYRDTVLLVGGAAAPSAAPAAAAEASAAPAVLTIAAAAPPTATAAAPSQAAPLESAASPGRCFSCRKRVGLTGFKCRCGNVFCGSHRYSDRHDCSFDYKAMARDSIAKANPLVVASKIRKI